MLTGLGHPHQHRAAPMQVDPDDLRSLRSVRSQGPPRVVGVSTPSMSRESRGAEAPLLHRIKTFGAEYRGVVGYYLLATDVWRFNRLRWVAETSMLKTLAAKHQSTVTKMAAKHKTTIETPHGLRTCFEARVETRRQAAIGRPVRRDTTGTGQGCGPGRPHPRPGSLPPQGAGHPAPETAMRAVRRSGQGRCAPSPPTRQPGRTRTRPARVGGPHDQETAQDPRGLPPLPRDHPPQAAHRQHGVDHGEPRHRKMSAGFGGRSRGKGPVCDGHLAARPIRFHPGAACSSCQAP